MEIEQKRDFIKGFLFGLLEREQLLKEIFELVNEYAFKARYDKDKYTFKISCLIKEYNIYSLQRIKFNYTDYRKTWRF